VYIGGLENELLLRERAHAEIGRNCAERRSGAEMEHSAAVHGGPPGWFVLARTRGNAGFVDRSAGAWYALVISYDD
jgi:hypothetical protein